MARFGVMLDANVLVPISLIDTLLNIADQGLFQPLWSDVILDETLQTLKLLYSDKHPSMFEARIESMSRSFPQARIAGWESLEVGLRDGLPDPDDAHVVAAAILGRAELIVTSNLKDFPAATLSTFGLQAISPNEFLLDLLHLDAQLVIDSVNDQVAQMSRPSLTVEAVLNRLTQFAPDFVTEFKELIR